MHRPEQIKYTKHSLKGKRNNLQYYWGYNRPLWHTADCFSMKLGKTNNNVFELRKIQ